MFILQFIVFETWPGKIQKNYITLIHGNFSLYGNYSLYGLKSKGPVTLKKRHNGRPKIRCWLHPLPPATKTDKTLRKQNEKERTMVVCTKDVKQINIGSLANESG